MKALEKDRNRRYETASALRRRRAAVPGRRAGAGVPAVGVVPVPQVRPAEQGRGAGRRRASPLGVLLAVGGLTALVGAGGQQRAGQGRAEADEGRPGPGEADQRRPARALEREQWTLYFQRIALAARELEARNVGRAEELLEECPVAAARLGVALPEAPLPPGAVHLPRASGGWFSSVAVQPGRQDVAFDRASAWTDSLGEITVWDRRDGQASTACSGTVGPVAGWRSARTASGSPRPGEDKTLKVWDVATGKELRSLTGHTGVRQLRGRSARTASSWPPGAGTTPCGSGTPTTFQELRTLRGHTGGGLRGRVRARTGGWRRPASTGRSGSGTRRPAGRSTPSAGTPARSSAVAFSRDGTRLASVRAWTGRRGSGTPGAGRHLQTLRDET